MSDAPNKNWGPKSSPTNMDSLSTGSSISPELERDYYKEKVEHFKVLIRKLQDEVQSYKLRKEGTATVSKLLQEAKQECVSYTKKIRAYESVFRILQSRLEKNGLSSEITLQDDEQYLPGNSKSLIDNLTRENKRLRNVLKANTGDPEEFARLQQELQERNQANSTLQTRIVEIEEVLRASDNEKDQTITQLREQLSHLNREISARDVKCSSLAKEAEKLQKQLEDVAYQCHDMAKKLHQQMNLQSTPAETAETNLKEESPMDVNDDFAALTDENKVLKLKVQEITDMNKRWQDYNKQRETYVNQLTRELKEERSAQAQQSNNDSNREFQVQMNQVLDEARRTIETANRQRNQVQAQLDSANRHVSMLTEEVRALKQRRASDMNPDGEETIQALKAQIQICTEDFESERKDREKAQTKINRQESEINRLRKEVDDLRRQHRQSSSPVQTIPQTQYTDPYYQYQPMGSPIALGTERLAARGVGRTRGYEDYNVIDGLTAQHDGAEKSDAIKDITKHNVELGNLKSRGTNNRLSDDDYHSLRTSSLSSNSNRLSPTPSPRRSENASPICNITSPCINTPSAACNTENETAESSACLKCPKCAKEYTADEHSELLDHIELCCD